MLSKKWVTLVLACGILMALIVPVMAQDNTAATEPTEAPVVVPTPAPLVALTDLFVSSQFSRVNVRSGPATNFTIIGALTFADNVDITGQNADGDWLRVNFNGQEGWVFADVVEINGDITPVPVVEASAPVVITDVPDTDEVITDTGEVMVRTLFNTNLRSTFSTEAEIIDVLPFDTDLVPLGRTDDSNWLQVTIEDQNGWIYAPILFFASGDVETLPVLATVPDVVVPVEPS